MLRIHYTTTRSVKEPNRGTPGSAGIDFYVPKFDIQFRKDILEKNKNLMKEESIKSGDSISIVDDKSILYDNGSIKLNPLDRILIPSGVYVKLPDHHALVAFNKSGISTKRGLDHLASVVDSDYTGEVHISLVNTSGFPVYISEDEKILQFILLPIPETVLLKEESLSDLYDGFKSERGSGGFGSTDNK